MSPTQTADPPAGASASTSTTRARKSVTPSVLPLAAPTTKSCEPCPESLVVTIVEPRSTSPLDSEIRGSWNLNNGPESDAAAVGTGPRTVSKVAQAEMARHFTAESPQDATS